MHRNTEYSRRIILADAKSLRGNATKDRLEMKRPGVVDLGGMSASPSFSACSSDPRPTPSAGRNGTRRTSRRPGHRRHQQRIPIQKPRIEPGNTLAQGDLFGKISDFASSMAACNEFMRPSMPGHDHPVSPAVPADGTDQVSAPVVRASTCRRFHKLRRSFRRKGNTADIAREQARLPLYSAPHASVATSITKADAAGNGGDGIVVGGQAERSTARIPFGATGKPIRRPAGIRRIPDIASTAFSSCSDRY